MGLFGRKKEPMKTETVPQLPSLPQLPSFSEPEEEQMEVHGLPSFPSNYSGNQFSQSMIKEAVSGEKEEDYAEEEDSDELANAYDMRMQQARRPMMQQEQAPIRRYTQVPQNMSQEPLFVRIDKFEGAHNILNETKRKVAEIESAIEEIKSVKEKEERELQEWENEVRSMKEQIEKIDRDLFSKI